jgi:hypothetical protein
MTDSSKDVLRIRECPTCGAEIVKRPRACPGCGQALRSRSSNYWALLIALAAAPVVVYVLLRLIG